MIDDQARWALLSALRVEQRGCWERGDRVPAEEFLRRYPAAEADADGALELVYNEVVLRERLGETPLAEEYLGRFPGLATRIAPLFEVHRALGSGRALGETTGRGVGGPGWEETIDPHAPGATGPERLAPASFEVLRELGQGGLGRVSLAVDRALHREVALKEIRPDRLDDPSSRARFLLEAEVTGRLEHPGIVPVYCLGRDGGGRPFYAMRFIRGESLKEEIERYDGGKEALGRDPGARSIALRQLLGRFVAVCNAVAFAHSRGVIHRDLKPANVMLGPYGETLVVDWGLAKAIGLGAPTSGGGEEELRPASSLGEAETITGVALGTPAYMSPEQAAGDIGRLGPASDVYGLGATLYHLLAGRPPFEDGRPNDLLERVRRGDFPPPRAIRPDVPRALEAVCLKAMATAPEGRYETARALADDVERWLAGAPVSAWPEPWSVRARRWLGRHRTLVAAATATVLVAVTALGVTAGLLAGKNAELRHERDVAEGRLDLALGAIGQFRKAVAENVDVRDRPDLALLRKELLKAPLEFYSQLRQDVKRGGGSRPDAPARLAQALGGLALITAEVGSQPQAIGALREAIGVLEPLDRDRPSPHRGDLAESCFRLGVLLVDSGRTDEARACFERARSLWSALARDDPADPEWRAEVARAEDALAVLHRAAGRHPEARSRHEQALAMREALAREYPEVSGYRADLALTRMNLGQLETDQGRVHEAQAEFEKARDLQEGLARERPEVAVYRRSLAYTDFKLGDLLDAQGRRIEARACYERAADLHEALAREHPTVTSYRAGLAWNVAVLGHILATEGRMDEARDRFARSIELREALVRENPDVELHRHGLAWSYHRLAEVQFRTRRPAEALSASERARGHMERLVRGNPENLEYRNFHGWVLRQLGSVLMERGRGPEALAAYRGAVEHQRLAFAKAPRRFRDDLEDHYLALLVAQRRLGLDVEAAAASREARAALEQEEDASPARGDETAKHLVFLACLDAIEGAPVVRGRTDRSAERALARLRQAVAGGYRDLASLRTEPALDPLRPTPEFQELLLDASFPADPFGR